jgi:hypothetical protein
VGSNGLSAIVPEYEEAKYFLNGEIAITIGWWFTWFQNEHKNSQNLSRNWQNERTNRKKNDRNGKKFWCYGGLNKWNEKWHQRH